MRQLCGRRILAILAPLALLAAAPQAEAQGGAPGGSYRSQCRDIQMNGQFLSAWCRGSQGSGQSSINVLSCSTDIGVGPDGGLVCGGPGVGGGPAPPTAYPPPGVYPPPGGGGGYYPPPGGGGGRWSATLYEKRDFRGRSIEVNGDTPNLNNSGLNDRVGSIRFGRRSGPWQVCTNASFRGNCTTVDRSISDTRRIGMWDAISSLRPLDR